MNTVIVLQPLNKVADFRSGDWIYPLNAPALKPVFQSRFRGSSCRVSVLRLLTLLFVLDWLMVARAADSATELFQKGLIAEEVNRDLETAIGAYQAAIAQFDEQRKLAATAIYRLAECYRKQGKPDLARPLYARVVREFSDQTDLARLSLEPSGLALAKSTEAKPSPEVVDEESKEIQRLTAVLRDSPDLLNRPENGITPLQRAVRNGQVRVVRFLIEQGAEVDRAINGLTPLHFAAAFGHKAIAEVLLDAKANSNAAGQLGVTPLHLAARNGFPAVAATLLARTANPNAVARSGNMFLPGNKSGQSVSVENLLGGTPLHWAAQGGHNSVVRLLLEKGADVNAPDPGGETPLMRALAWSQPAAVEQLLTAGSDVNRATSNDETALIRAIGNGDGKIVEALLAKGADVNRMDRVGNTPLKAAIAKGDAIIAGTLLASGAKVNASFTAGEAALSYALQKKNAEMVTLLLRLKPELEIGNQAGITPLLLGIEWGMPDIMEAILQAGANPNLVNPVSGQTPLFAALERPKIVAILLSHGAQPNFMDRNGATPLNYTAVMATSSGGVTSPTWLAVTESAKLLRAAGANPDFQYANAITLGRKAGDARIVQFQRGTNDMNRYTLLEMLGWFYLQGSEVASPRQSPGRRSRGPIGQPGLTAGMSMPGIHPSLYGTQLSFPDFRRVTIRNVAATNMAAPEATLNLLDGQAKFDCTKDRSLRWGDLVEIPETDHPINEGWNGMNESLRASLKECLRRRVSLSVQASVSLLTLLPGTGQVSEPPTDDKSNYTFNISTFTLSGVLTRIPGLLRSSSDLTRVKVRRPAGDDQAAREWTLNAALPDPDNDLWLRDGDMIEILDKE